ncbi:MAG: DUF1579 domain-containing protein [Ferruginibacter sp.]
MKNFIITACFLSAAIMGCTDEKKTDDSTVTTMSDTSVRTSSDTGTATTSGMNETPSAPVDSATMMKNWQAYATPGTQHAMMAKWNGTWTGKMMMWHAPGTPPDSTTAIATNKMIYGGRYQQSTHTGNMMGMKFEGQSIMGYDNAKKVFQSTWMDNMGTGIAMLEGPWDEATKSLTMTGKMVDPSKGDGKEITMRHVMKVIDDNNQVYEMYCPGPDGKEFKNMEIRMVRK